MTIKHSNWSNNMEEPMKELEKGRKISKKKSQKKDWEKWKSQKNEGHINRWCKSNGIVGRDRKLESFNIYDSGMFNVFWKNIINLLGESS